MTLDQVKKGQSLQIQKIADVNLRDQIIRLGIYEGAKVLCAERIGHGPVILKNRMQQIAIGDKLAQKISIQII